MVDQTIKERDTEYGDAKGHFSTTQVMYQVWLDRVLQSNSDYPDQQVYNMHKHVTFFIIDKLVRSCCTPTKEDHWEDIQGYAKLLQDEIKKTP